MAGYRGIDKRRQMRSMQNMLNRAGQTATWRRWVSAGGGNDIVGIGPTQYYAEQPIRAWFGALAVGRVSENQTPVGQIAAGAMRVTTLVQVSRKDQLVWNGNTYEVDSEAIPNVIHGGYTYEIKRSSS